MLGNALVHAVVPAADIARAKAFYGERLGLAPDFESPGGLVYRCKDSWFVLFPSMGAGTNQSTALEWIVDSLDAEMGELRSRGVVFEEYDYPEFKTVNGVAEAPEGRTAWFKDSEGNILALTELRDPAAREALKALRPGG